MWTCWLWAIHTCDISRPEKNIKCPVLFLSVLFLPDCVNYLGHFSESSSPKMYFTKKKKCFLLSSLYMFLGSNSSKREELCLWCDLCIGRVGSIARTYDAWCDCRVDEIVLAETWVEGRRWGLLDKRCQIIIRRKKLILVLNIVEGKVQFPETYYIWWRNKVKSVPSLQMRRYDRADQWKVASEVLVLFLLLWWNIQGKSILGEKQFV